MTVACDCDGVHEDVRASVIAGVDTPRVLEAPEHILDFVTLPVEGFVEVSG